MLLIQSKTIMRLASNYSMRKCFKLTIDYQIQVPLTLATLSHDQHTVFTDSVLLSVFV